MEMVLRKPTRASYQGNTFSEEEEGISRRDKLDDISIYIQIYKYFLFDMTYSHQTNSSDINVYSYRANKFALLMARSFPKDIMFQLHALVRSKKYSSGANVLRGAQIDMEDDERGVLALKLSKDIGRGCALEGQYDLRRASSQEDDDIYTKGVFTLSLSMQF